MRYIRNTNRGAIIAPNNKFPYIFIIAIIFVFTIFLCCHFQIIIPINVIRIMRDYPYGKFVRLLMKRIGIQPHFYLLITSLDQQMVGNQLAT